MVKDEQRRAGRPPREGGDRSASAPTATKRVEEANAREDRAKVHDKVSDVR